MVLTETRQLQAQKDFADYARVGGSVGAAAVVAPAAASVAAAAQPAVQTVAALIFGMPNHHTPGSIALILLGGRIVRHGQADGDWLN
jgi:hypothetical protein